MTTSASASARPASATIVTMILAGATATIAFDIWGQAISPMLGWARLAPTGLARSLLGTFGLPNGEPAGWIMHLFFVGLIGYPIGWFFVFRPLWDRIVGAGGWLLPAAVYGFGLWIFAIGLVTSVAGLPFFLGFTGITWVALVGHVLYGIVCGWVGHHMAARS